NARVTFLVIANTSVSTAHAVSTIRSSAQQYSFGDIEGHSAVMIPLRYVNASNGVDIADPDPTELSYESRYLDHVKTFTTAIPPAANVTWTPVVDEFSNIGRASEGNESTLKELLPSDESPH